MSMRIESDLPQEVEELIRRVIGAAIEVHRHLGPGFLESIYQRALCHQLATRGIACEREKEIRVRYKEIEIDGQRLDLVVEGKLILELKAAEAIAPIHQAQLLSYMRTAGIRAGLLINFNVKELRHGIKRMIL